MPLLPDRHTRALIVETTRWLPRPLRVGLRSAALERFWSARLRRADATFVRHPKCGSTWLRVMLFRLYQQRNGLPPRRVVKTDEMHLADPRLPRFHITNGHYGFERATRRFFETPAAAAELGGSKVVFLARHPCDVAVSWYYQITRRTSPWKRELILASLAHPIDRKTIGLAEFVAHPELGVPGLIDYLNWWHAHLAPLPNARIVRYEDLRARPAETLHALVDFLGADFDDAAIEDAVAFGSFDNLRSLEQARYFENSGLTPRDDSDPNTVKVRKGRVGGFREALEPALADSLAQRVRKELTPAYGYAELSEP